MNSVFRQGVPAATILQLVADLSWLFVAGIVVIRFNEQLGVPLQSVVAPALVFARVIVLLNIAFGMYRRADKLTSSTYLVRMLLVPAIGVPLAYLIVSALPTGRLLQNNLGMAVLVAIGGLLLIRHLLVLPLVANLLRIACWCSAPAPRRAWSRRRCPRRNLPGMSWSASTRSTRCSDMAVSPQRVIARGGPLEETVRQLADQRNHRRRARAARRRAAAARAARMQAERRAGHRPFALLRARARPGADRVAQGELADLRQRLPAGLAAHGRQAHVRHRRGRWCCSSLALPVMLVAALADRCRERRSGHLSAGARRPGRHDVHVLKFRSMRRDAERRRQAELGDGQRSARHARRAVHPPHAHRRAAAADQRPARRHELRRAAPGAAGVRRDADRADPVLRGAPQRQARRHRLGASALLLRRDGRAIDARSSNTTSTTSRTTRCSSISSILLETVGVVLLGEGAR